MCMWFAKKQDIKNTDNYLALERSSAEVQSISESCAKISFTTSGEILDANDMFLSCVGYTLAEVKGQHHSVFCPNGTAQSSEYKEFWSDLSRGTAQRGVFLRKSKTGQDVWLQATYIPVKIKGEVSHIIKIANLITDAYVKSLESRAIVDAVQQSNAVINFTPDGLVLRANKNFVQALGYNDESEIKGQHHRIFCDEEFYAQNPNFWKELSDGKSHNGLFKRISKTGKDVWIEASYNPILDHMGNVSKITKIATDITQRVEVGFAIQKAAEVAHGTSVETAQASEKGNAIMGELFENYKKITANLEISSTHIEDLTQQSAEISNIVTTIKSIADQTNLLALNAAIEAARAGEQGRGFAVVADEVRTLAASTTKSTEEINTMVDRNNKLVEQSRQSMESVAKQSGMNTELIDSASEIINEILKGANHVSEVVSKLIDNSKK